MVRIDRRLALGALLVTISAPASCFAPDYAAGAGGAGTSPGSGGGSTTSTTSSSTSSGAGGAGGSSGSSSSSSAGQGGGMSCTTAAQCDDLDACTVDGCIGGQCAHQAPDDGNPCTVDRCKNGVAQHGNAPVDTKCGNGLACDGAGTCAGCTSPSQCPDPGVCREAACSASKQCNPTDAPVGTPCAGGACDGSGACVGGCGDAKKNGAETDVDCGGGTCPTCADTKTCLVNSDCLSGYCAPSMICATQAMPTCSDGLENGAETDVDCGGGTCPTCPNGKLCVVGLDCQSSTCTNGVCAAGACPAPKVSCNGSCVDLSTDSTNCGACGKACGGGGCQSGNCVCSPGHVNCGGSCVDVATDPANCGACGNVCPGSCMQGLCSLSLGCLDGKKDGQETDVDCGGGTCPKCAAGKICAASSDCLSDVCGVGNQCK